jgi:hypothetical protein
MKYYRMFALLLIMAGNCCNVVSAQNTHSRILVENGGNVQFNINSLTKYTEGQELNYWTRLAISFTDTTDLGVATTATWKLQIKANTSIMTGDYGNDLDLDFLVVNVDDAGGSNELGSFIIPGETTLTSDFQTLIEGAPQGDFSDNIIFISYKLGTGADALLGNPSDYYFVDIIFELSKWAD